MNLGAEYVWLDVVCLRQVGKPSKEDLRKEEWKVDVPTIGAVYHEAKTTVHYFSGLGRPFRIGDLQSERHWLNRSWTLQELGGRRTISGHNNTRITAGITQGSPACPWKSSRNDLEFYKRIRALDDDKNSDRLHAVMSMRSRFATKPLDKIFGLLHILCEQNLDQQLPCYHERMANEPEKAWDMLLMDRKYYQQFLHRYPFPGTGRYKWAPSWQQVMEHAPLPPIDSDLDFNQGGFMMNPFILDPKILHDCIVRGFEGFENSDEDRNPKPRKGTVVISVTAGRRRTSHEYIGVAEHKYVIPRGSYSLISVKSGGDLWLVGHFVTRYYTTFEKVSVLRILNLSLCSEKTNYSCSPPHAINLA